MTHSNVAESGTTRVPGTPNTTNNSIMCSNTGCMTSSFTSDDRKAMRHQDY